MGNFNLHVAPFWSCLFPLCLLDTLHRLIPLFSAV